MIPQPNDREITGTATTQALLFDITESGLLAGKSRIPSASSAAYCNSTNLILPAPKHGEGFLDTLAHYDGPTLQRAFEILEDYGSLSSTVVVLGMTSDPLHPFDGKFDVTLKLLEMIAARRPQYLVVQTRSPLIVLALPILKALGDRVSVTIALEAARDADNERLTPDQPRPSERIKAARALKRLGIETVVQVAPVIAADNTKRRIREFAAVIDEISCSVRITEYADIAGKPARSRKRNSPRLLRDAHILLHEELHTIAPSKTVSWGFAASPSNRQRSLAA